MMRLTGMTGDAGIELNASGEDEYGVNCSTTSPASDDKDIVIEEPLTTPIPPPTPLILPRQSGCIRCPLTPDDDPKFFIRSQKTREVIAPGKTWMEAGDQMLESTSYVVFMLMTKPQSY